MSEFSKFEQEAIAKIAPKSGLEIRSYKSLPAGMREIIGKLLAAYTNGELDEKPQMLPITMEGLEAKHNGWTAFEYGDFSGIITASQAEEWNNTTMHEVGNLWVPRQFRNHGIAKVLVAAMTIELVLEDALPYAFCNPLSKPIFKGAGYAEAADSAVPPSAFDLCAACPMKPLASDGCCDEVMLYKGESS